MKISEEEINEQLKQIEDEIEDKDVRIHGYIQMFRVGRMYLEQQIKIKDKIITMMAKDIIRLKQVADENYVLDKEIQHYYQKYEIEKEEEYERMSKENEELQQTDEDI